MSLHLGTDKIEKILLGTTEVHKIYLGTDLVYVNAQPKLYDYTEMQKISISGDNAFYKDISWSGNLLPRPNYTSDTVTNYSFEDVESLGSMNLTVGDNGSGSLSYNSHICTTNLITIPRTATKMKVLMERNNPTGTYLKLALLPANASNSMDISNGGVLETFTPSKGVGTYQMNLASGMAGTKLYRAVINIQGPRDTEYALYRIYRVWFE